MRAVLLCLLLVGCASPQGDYCLNYFPVYTHANDTEGTRRQVDMNNAVWLRLCGASGER